METDIRASSCVENSEQASVIISVDDHHDNQAPAGQVRSYECTFCKRGFSNAQALGGHMNIHRKDRAKLKQTNLETQLVSEYNWSAKRTHDEHSAGVASPVRSDVVDGCSFYRWPWFPPREDQETHGRELRQLQLFDDSATGVMTERVAQTGFQERRSHPNQYGLAEEKLDLELRLGPEP
ncbi:hypothetical protein H6P81_006015 [Aristolochia fimbriata]|uniref:C2H2-type domain-containing protein n=1 Tax=Aristolochia fimbriata TaxID=158543 RepID=A0AAV7EXB5_ARIFI|nr:hypothetical protein H6P81_006015 [Aristolochia fimbriata]